MKRLFDYWGKKKRSQENYYIISDTSLPHNIRNRFSETHVIKYTPFDSDVYQSNENGFRISHNSGVTDLSSCQKCPPQPESSRKIKPAIADLDLLVFQPKNDPVLSTTIPGLSGTVLSTRSEKTYNLEKKSKTGKNVYMINISNSKYFHIGPQNTVNVDEKSFTREGFQGYEVHHGLKNYSSQLKVDFQNLLDCKERMAEKYISLISQHMDDHWKEFLKYLGLKKIALEVLELRNNKNQILSVYDALHNYITLFPNTSLGFIIHALDEIHQVVAIEKLVQELNSVQPGRI